MKTQPFYSQNENITTLNEELHSLKEALFTKSQESDDHLAKIAQLNQHIENMKQQQVMLKEKLN